MTRDAFTRKYHTSERLENLLPVGQIGAKGDALLLCAFCPHVFHCGCFLELVVRGRAQKQTMQWLRSVQEIGRLDQLGSEAILRGVM